jgi:hypothetical protein
MLHAIRIPFTFLFLLSERTGYDVMNLLRVAECQEFAWFLSLSVG